MLARRDLQRSYTMTGPTHENGIGDETERATAASATHTLFVDESGHAGINYLDDAQPFHVAAGILIAHPKRPIAQALVRSKLRDQEKELKGSRLMKSQRGQQRAINILTDIGQAGALPFFVLMDRRFSIAGKLVDVFLDPMHQDAVDWLPTSAIQARYDITEWLHDHLYREIVDEFARAYKAPSRDAFDGMLTQLIAFLRTREQGRLALAFAGAQRNLNEILEAETYGNAAGAHAQWASLNMPAFVQLVRMVDVIMDAPRGRYDVTHDVTVEFEALFEHVLARFNQPDATTPDLKLPDGTTHRGVLRNFGAFQTSNSTQEPMLQAADLLAASVNQVARVALAPNLTAGTTLQELARLTLTPLLFSGEDPTFARIYAHTKTRAAVISRMFDGASFTK